MCWHPIAGTYEVHEDTLSLLGRQEPIPALVQAIVNYLKQMEKTLQLTATPRNASPIMTFKDVPETLRTAS